MIKYQFSGILPWNISRPTVYISFSASVHLSRGLPLLLTPSTTLYYQRSPQPTCHLPSLLHDHFTFKSFRPCISLTISWHHITLLTSSFCLFSEAQLFYASYSIYLYCFFFFFTSTDLRKQRFYILISGQALHYARLYGTLHCTSCHLPQLSLHPPPFLSLAWPYFSSAAILTDNHSQTSKLN